MTGTNMTGTTVSWTNWAGNQTASPVEVAHPRDADEIAGVVKDAAAAGRRVKAIGSGHSFTAIGLTDGVQLQLDRHAGLVSMDVATGLVTVEAGMPLHVLNPLLSEHGLAMPNLGDIDRQTISGALSTGTHGTGARLPGLGAMVAGLELVLADGSVVSCSAAERPEVFAAARVGLGALGVLSTVTLQTVPEFMLRAVEGPDRLDAVLDSFVEQAERHDHMEFYWFPHTDRVLTKRNDRVAAGEPGKPLGRLKGWVDDELLSNKVFELTNRVTRRLPGAIPRVNRLAAGALSSREFTAPSYDVFCSPRSVRFVESEWALPREALPQVVREIDAFVRRAGLRVSFPVEVRVAAADDVWLSTAHERPSAYVAVHMYRGTPFEEYFRGVEDIAVAAGGRPHWGKLHTRTADQLREVYPRFADFVALRDQLDPQRVFANDYLDRVLGA